MMPKRIQRQRTRGWRMSEGAVYVGHPSRWGSPYRVGDVAYTGSMPFPLPTFSEPRNEPPVVAERCESIAQSVAWYRRWADVMLARHPEWLAPLRGRDLVCWCPLCPEHREGRPLGVRCADCAPCHADLLLELANARDI